MLPHVMGNRDYKQFGSGGYFHIYNRGNEKRNVFLDDDDFSFFLLKLRQNLFPDMFTSSVFRSQPLPTNAFSLVSYCLMPNHFHLLIRQNSDLPTSKLMLRTCTSYSKYFNKKHNRVGHIFQDQFKQVVIDGNSYLVWLSAYIHQNPVVVGMVSKPENYRWSSYREFVGSESREVCEKDIILDQFKNLKEFKNFVAESCEIIKNRKDMERLLLDF